MQKQTNRQQKLLTYALLLIGILGIGFLIYVVVDRVLLSTPAVSPLPNPEAAAAPNPIASETEAIDDMAGVTIGIRVGQRAPDFRLRSLDNENVALSDFLGRVVILDFWASWCSPCKSTMPGLENLARELAPDVVLVGVSLDRSAVNASSYLASNNYDAMIALYESYTSAYEVFKTYGGGGIPKTYVIDRTGIIRYTGHPASLSRQAIERLI
ncbi:TlpA family protein disulfide reductase [Candidatus Bipolaricaulota bacterium]|nr:TlpA family protein disulfide reductase [Candidatus Bipolaricaulota bacterium]